MKKHCFIILFALCGLMIKPTAIYAQAAPKQVSVKISGEVITPLIINEANFKTYTQTTVIRKDKDGKDHTYGGVILADILAKAGVTLGKALMGENLTKYVLVEASDGYQVIFALPELDKDYADRTIILASQVDGQPLAPGDGPFRIIVQNEKKPARCIKQVTAIKVMYAK